MKKIFVICFVIALFIGIFLVGGCSGGSEDQTTETTSAITYATTESETTTPLEQISINFPEEYVLMSQEAAEEWIWPERQFRFAFYSISGIYLDLGPEDIVDEWMREILPGIRSTEQEPAIFSFIKEFDVAFEGFELTAKWEYRFRNEMNFDLTREDWEIPNPYLLFTFNLERINDYFSIDQARHTSARLWLEEWLQTNEPYASYSAFRAANSQ